MYFIWWMFTNLRRLCCVDHGWKEKAEKCHGRPLELLWQTIKHKSTPCWMHIERFWCIWVRFCLSSSSKTFCLCWYRANPHTNHFPPNFHTNSPHLGVWFIKYISSPITTSSVVFWQQKESAETNPLKRGNSDLQNRLKTTGFSLNSRGNLRWSSTTCCDSHLQNWNSHGHISWTALSGQHHERGAQLGPVGRTVPEQDVRLECLPCRQPLSVGEKDVPCKNLTAHRRIPKRRRRSHPEASSRLQQGAVRSRSMCTSADSLDLAQVWDKKTTWCRTFGWKGQSQN